MNHSGKGRGNRFMLPIALIVILALELLICIANVGSSKNRFLYGMNYELIPLEMKSVTVTNREDQKEIYGAYGGQRFYEVIISWENVGPYYGDYQTWVEITSKEEKGYVYDTRPVDGYDLGRRESYTQTVPARKNGCFVWYISANEYVDNICIEEKGEKLEGNGKSVTVPLPQKAGEAVTVEVTD